MTLRVILVFLSQHKEGLGLFALAMAVTMRPRLPWPFSLVEPLEWLYEWVRDGILTFVSMRGPAHSESTAQREVEKKIITDESGKKTELVKAITETIVQSSDPKSTQQDSTKP